MRCFARRTELPSLASAAWVGIRSLSSAMAWPSQQGTPKFRFTCVMTMNHVIGYEPTGPVRVALVAFKLGPEQTRRSIGWSLHERF